MKREQEAVISAMTREELWDDEPEEKNKPGRFIKLIAVVMIVAFTVFAIPGLSYLFTDRLNFLEQNKVLLDDPIVEKCKPAVVSIETVSRSDSFLRVRHSGTGFNIAPTGTIITNKHVVDNASEIVVSFSDGTRFYVNEYETVPGNDIAVIKIKGHDLPTIALNINDHVKSGDIVTIIGNPLGFEKITQRGEVGEYYNTQDSTIPIFDIKLEANPGSSGSPVINNQAQVVGIVFAAARADSKSQSVSRALAIPIEVLPAWLF